MNATYPKRQVEIVTLKVRMTKEHTWQESLPPSGMPAQIMLSVMLPPYLVLHSVFVMVGTVTSNKVPDVDPPVKCIV